MNVTLTSLEALILKATHETLPCPDPAALEAFCTIMRDSAEGPQLAAQALATRIHSHNPREAMLALTMLDRCMRRSDAGFHAEVGKFRFLNEMIKLVSPKYFADRTAPEVRTRVLQLLYAWSIEYPKETKFKVAYEMLKNQGVVKETPPPMPPEDTVSAPKSRAKNAIFEDEEKSKLLQKLLQSKKPEDLQHANRLIKTMVREEERRSEANSRRAQEVSAALDSAGLLMEMLRHAASASADEEQLIHELHARCARLRPVLQRLAAADADADNLSDILHANDVLDEVFEKYNTFVGHKEDKTKPQTTVIAERQESLLDFAGANPAHAARDQKNVIDELGDIFATEPTTNTITEPLKPVSLMPNDVDLLGHKPKAEGWNVLDSLGEQLMKQSLPDSSKRVDSFNGKITKKIPMNALEKSPKKETQLLNNGAMLDLDFFTKKPEEKREQPTPVPSQTDDVMVDITDGASCNKSESPLDKILDIGLPLANSKCDNVESPIDKEVERKDSVKKYGEVKSLSDINVSLTSVQPSDVPPMTIFEEEGGVSVVLHFCKDKPRPDVNVIVVSTTSRSSLPIEDYRFQSVVPKGCKVRLLPASGSALPPRLPFVPSAALTQLLLLARPRAAPPPTLKFLITYTCDDDAYSEMGEVTDLPLDDI
ncbi:ADP-ribosylation factor-binding protein GGA3 isoform X2 [Amyelois transitella]|uniref:ADP-ribosylation factor-binding protein GGA3 isoform X2 n=1 Tax=Amyelois transitella TaxID=680683 RepID=UPI00298F7E6D|nr:ADP-ribosylation factor-binding protein GGA3 isoform X2 [Amyelois transitella]